MRTKGKLTLPPSTSQPQHCFPRDKVVHADATNGCHRRFQCSGRTILGERTIKFTSKQRQNVLVKRSGCLDIGAQLLGHRSCNQIPQKITRYDPSHHLVPAPLVVQHVGSLCLVKGDNAWRCFDPEAPGRTTRT